MWTSACQDAIGKGDEGHCLLFLETQPSLHYRCQRRAGVGQPKQVVIKNSRWERGFICVGKDCDCK